MLSVLITAKLLLLWAPVLCEIQMMQGTWRLSISVDGKLHERFANGLLVRIHGNKIIVDDKNASEYEKSIFVDSDAISLNQIGIDPFTKPKKIWVMWSEGIYEVGKDRLRFCIKYAGQGVEGEAARKWRAPVDFTIKEGQDHKYWTFERVKK